MIIRLLRACLLVGILPMGAAWSQEVSSPTGVDVLAAALRSEYRLQVGRQTENVVLTTEEASALTPVLGGGEFILRCHRLGRDAFVAVAKGDRDGVPHWEWFRATELDQRVQVHQASAEEVMAAAIWAGGHEVGRAFLIGAYAGGGRWELRQDRTELSGSRVIEGRTVSPFGAVEQVTLRLRLDDEQLVVEQRSLVERAASAVVEAGWAEGNETWQVEGPSRWAVPKSLQKLEFLARRGSKDSKYKLALELMQLKDIRARSEAVLWLQEAKRDGMPDAGVLLEQLQAGLGRMPEDRAFSPHPNCLHPKEENPTRPRDGQRHEILTSRETR